MSLTKRQSSDETPSNFIGATCSSARARALLRVASSHDCTPLSKRSRRWHGLQNRNQVETDQGARWLTVPVHASITKSIAETPVASAPWARKHLATVEQSYRCAPGLPWFRDVLAPIAAAPHASLSELDIAVCEAIFDRLGAPCRRVRASTLDVAGTREGLVLNIAHKTGATRYLSGPGAAAYQLSENFAREGITLSYVQYHSTSYAQCHDATLRGSECGSLYAEAFDIVRMVGSP